MKLSPAQRAWEILGWVVAGYSIYEKLKTMTAIKNDLFPYMSQSEQAIVAKYLGAPIPAVPVAVVGGVIPVTTTVAPTIEQVKSGT